MLAVNTRKSQRFLQVCFVADHIRGQVGSEDVVFREAPFDRWADAVPLAELLAVDLRGDQIADDVLAGVGSALVDLGEEVVLERR